jgi:HlyD family secretion protein
MGKAVWIALTLAAVFALGLGGGVWLDRHFLDTGPADLANSGDYPARAAGSRVVALGRLEPAAGIFRVGAPAGERLLEVRVKPGDAVRPGDLLANLDSRPVREAELRLAEAQRDEAKRRRQAAQAAGDAQVQEIEAKIAQARIQAPLDQEVQKAKIRVLEEQVKSARANYEKMRQIRSFSEQEISQQALLARQTQEELSGAQAVLQRIDQTGSANSKIAELQLATAKANLQKSLAEIPLPALEAAVGLAEQKLRAAEIKAPAAGRVLGVHGRAGEVVGSRPLFELAAAGPMAVVADVYEADAARVRDWLNKHPPVRAEIASRALGDRPLSGTVQAVGDTVGKNAVEVRIALSAPDSAVGAKLINLPVQVTILDPTAP